MQIGQLRMQTGQLPTNINNKRHMGHDSLTWVKKAIAYLQMPCNILPVLPQQLGAELWQCH